MHKFIPVLMSLACFIPAGFAAEQTAPPAELGPTIRTTVNEVALDLVVRDKHGKLVKNLKPGDVQIFENGVLQQIRSFHLAAGHPMAEPASGAKPAILGAPGSSLPLRKVNLVCIVLHNQDNLNVTMKKFTLEAVQQFLQSTWQPDTWVGVFSLGTRLSVLYPFTTNRNELLQAAGRGFTGGNFQLAKVADAVLNGTPNLDVVQGFGSQGAKSGTGGGSEALQTGALNNAATLDVTDTTGLASGAQRGDLVDQQRQFGHIQGMESIDQMKLMIGQIGQLPGHKTVLMLSPGLPSNGNPELFDAILEKARQTDISVYALDTNGLSENSNLQAANQGIQYAGSLSQQQGKVNMATGAGAANTDTMGSVGRDAELMRQNDYVDNAVRGSDTQAPLRALSEGTGGFLIGGTNDLRKPFQHLIEDVGMHYEAVYRPVSDKFDGRMRKIEVKLARADYTVESRNGYYAMPEIHGSVALTPVEIAGLSALNANPAPHAFDFRSAAYQFRSDSATNQIGFALELPAAHLTATAEPQQKVHRLHVSVLALVKDANGQVVDKFSQDSPYVITDDKMAAVETMPITWTHPFDLAPGHYSVEVAVLDRESNRASTSVLQLDNPEHKGLGLSSIMLVRQVAQVNGPDAANPFEFSTNRVVPGLNSALGKDAQPYVYFVVYPDKANTEKSKLGVQFLVNGKVVAEQTADLPAADASGAVPMVVGAVIKPGECELKITAMQGNATTTHSVKYTVAN